MTTEELAKKLIQHTAVDLGRELVLGNRRRRVERMVKQIAADRLDRAQLAEERESAIFEEARRDMWEHGHNPFNFCDPNKGKV